MKKVILFAVLFFSLLSISIFAQELEECENKEGWQIDKCYHDKAIELNNINLCNISGRYKDHCYYEFALKENIPELCYIAIKFENKCFRDLAIKLRNISLCDKTNGLREECYKEIILDEEDVHLCTYVEDEEECIIQIALKVENISYCDYVYDKEGCIFRIYQKTKNKELCGYLSTKKEDCLCKDDEILKEGICIKLSCKDDEIAIDNKCQKLDCSNKGFSDQVYIPKNHQCILKCGFFEYEKDNACYYDTFFIPYNLMFFLMVVIFSAYYFFVKYKLKKSFKESIMPNIKKIILFVCLTIFLLLIIDPLINLFLIGNYRNYYGWGFPFKFLLHNSKIFEPIYIIFNIIIIYFITCVIYPILPKFKEYLVSKKNWKIGLTLGILISLYFLFMSGTFYGDLYDLDLYWVNINCLFIFNIFPLILINFISNKIVVVILSISLYVATFIFIHWLFKQSKHVENNKTEWLISFKTSIKYCLTIFLILHMFFLLPTLNQNDHQCTESTTFVPFMAIIQFFIPLLISKRLLFSKKEKIRKSIFLVTPALASILPLIIGFAGFFMGPGQGGEAAFGYALLFAYITINFIISIVAGIIMAIILNHLHNKTYHIKNEGK